MGRIAARHLSCDVHHHAWGARFHGLAGDHRFIELRLIDVDSLPGADGAHHRTLSRDTCGTT